MRSLSDAQLVEAARAGDKKAFVEIVARYQAAVCALAFGVLGDFAASEDAGQETFLTAWRKMHDLREPDRLRAWLCQIARNAALAQLRRVHPTEPLDNALDLPEPNTTPDELAASEEEATLVRESLARLPEIYRTALTLYYREGQSVRAVAATLEIGEDAVKQRLARGREMLREQISGTVERVLTRTGPTAVFTMTVAVAIGALAAPAVVAAAAFGASAAAGAASTTPILTLMSSSKTVVTAAAVVTIACLPIGYELSKQLAKERASDSAALQQVNSAAVSPSRPVFAFEQSPLFAEWRALHEKHGTNAAAMPELYKAIEGMNDRFRKRAFTSALFAEWAQVDPTGGLRHLLSLKKYGPQNEFFREWLALDANAAVTALLASEGEWKNLARDSIVEIAKRVPHRVPQVAVHVEKTGNFWDTRVREAFAIYAQADPLNARAAAEKLPGSNQTLALAGVAQSWAKTDLDAVIEWARQLPDGVDRDEIVRVALLGKAEVDPIAALARVSEVPPGGSSGYFASTTGARVLIEAAQADFDATVEWLAANPGRLTREDLIGLANAVTARLNADPVDFLNKHANAGTLAPVVPGIESALLNDSGSKRESVWNWLKTQPESDEINKLKEHVINAAAWQDPDLALKIAADLPSTPQGTNRLQLLAQSLFNGGLMLDRFDSLLEKAPERLRPILIQQAFMSLGNRSDGLEDPQLWLERLKLLPDQASREQALSQIARGWAGRAPEEASAWARTLPSGAARDSAMNAAATLWAQNDLHGFAEHLGTLPPGVDRDRDTVSMISVIAEKNPEEAWQWGLSIEDKLSRTRAAYFTAQAYARKDLAAAQRMVETSPLEPELKQQIQQILLPPEQRQPRKQAP